MTAAPPTPLCVFLYGPPAVGKLTVAKALAARRDFRVLHNHVTLDAVAEVLPFGSEAFWAVVGRFRRDLVESAADARIDLVYTYVFAPGDESHVESVVESFESVGGSVAFFQLVAPVDELLRRVGAEERMHHGKISDAATLAEVLRQHDVYACVPGYDSVTIDVGVRSADQAADLIVQHVEGLGQRT